MTIYIDDQRWADWDPLAWFEEDLKAPTYAQIRKGDEYCAAKQYDLAIGCYQEALQDARRQRSWQVEGNAVEGSALVHLAEVYRIQGQFDQAVEAYQQATHCYRWTNDLHKEGIACRMMAMIWHARQDSRQALHCYQDALCLFDHLWQQHKQLGNRVKAAQYATWCQEMRVRIDEARVTYKPPKQAAKKVTKRAKIDRYAAELRLIPVASDRVSAGQPILAIQNIEDYVTTAVLRIGNIDFLVQPLSEKTRRRELRIGTATHFVLPVKGDSMRDKDILDGDYVLVRQQSSAENDEIVVARIGEEATVKEFYIEGNEIQLRPANKEMEPIVRKKDDPELRIEGIVIAVLKAERAI